MNLEASDIVGYLRLLESADLNGCDKVDSDTIPQEIKLFAGKRQVFGRGSQADILLNATKDGKHIISRAHVALTIRDQYGVNCLQKVSKLEVDNDVVAYVEDMDSLNGVFVNSIRVSNHMLRNGDILQLGGASEIPVGGKCLVADTCLRYRCDAICIKRGLETISEISDSKKVCKEKEQESSASISNFLKEIINKITKLQTYCDASELKILSEVLAVKSSIQNFIEKKNILEEATGSMSIKDVIYDSSKEIFLSISRDIASDMAKITRKEIDNFREIFEQGSLLTLRKENEYLKSQLLSLSSLPNNPTGNLQGNKPANFTCQIESQSLRSQLICKLCSDVLLDSAVLSCSHAFCRSCIEAYVKARKTTYELCRCPSCGASCCIYHRCDHLDNLVWIVLEAGNESEREHFQKRGEVALKVISRLKHEGGLRKVVYDSECLEEKAEDKSKELLPITCEYCGGSDHGDVRCPHKRNSYERSNDSDVDL